MREEEEKALISEAMIVDPEALSLVSIASMNEKDVLKISSFMEKSACYINAFKAASDFNDYSVVLGFCLVSPASLSYEHAWIKSPDGRHYDPTVESFPDSIQKGDVSYYEIMEIPIDSYHATQHKLGVSMSRPIDMTLLRISKETNSIFRYTRKK